MASKPKDWTGQKFGRLTAVKNTGNKIGGNFIWEYLCDCGKTVELKSGNVVAGDVSSCGCYRKDLLTTHGATVGKKLSKNKSGRTGVKWREDRKVWEARIVVDGNKIILYYGDSFEEACAARESAELIYYGFTKE